MPIENIKNRDIFLKFCFMYFLVHILKVLGIDEEIDEIVKKNEPSLALYADNDGLYFYEEILKNCKKYLNNKFMIAFEIGYTQGDRVRDFALKYLGDVSVSVEKDLSNRDRFVFIFNDK